jgi:hypothetical protein
MRTPGSDATAAPDANASRWEAAAQIRREHPGWVVIWVARKGEYQARPLFRARRGTVAAAATRQELTAQMEAIRRAAPRRPRLAPPLPPS